MPRHHRILVRFRMAYRTEWSDLHWCDIQEHENTHQIEVFVAPAQENRQMPEDSEFRLLTEDEAKKLLVIDLRNETPSCFTIIQNKVYLYTFDSRKFFNPQGQLWSISNNDYDASKSSLSIREVFGSEQKTDSRLQMRTSEFYNYNLVALSSEARLNFEQQYTGWQERIRNQALQQAYLTERAEQQRRQREEQERQIALRDNAWKTAPINIDMEQIHSSLDQLDRLALRMPILDALREIKRAANTKEEYIQALYAVIWQDESALIVDQNPNLNVQVKRLRDVYLSRYSEDLQHLFSGNDSNHPTLAVVYDFVLDCAFLELQVQDPSLSGSQSSEYKKTYPADYRTIRLGVEQSNLMVLDGRGVNEDDDGRLAQEYQDEEYALNLQTREIDNVLSHLSNSLQLPQSRNDGQHRNSVRQGPQLFNPPPSRPQEPRVQNPQEALRKLLTNLMGHALWMSGLYLACTGSVIIGLALILAGAFCLYSSALNVPERRPGNDAGREEAPRPALN